MWDFVTVYLVCEISWHCVLYVWDFVTVCIVSFHQQTRPVPFTVRAIVTSSDIVFNMQDIDFGFCTVLESVRRTVTITNKSVLPQPFGFCGVPDVSESLVIIYVQSRNMYQSMAKSRLQDGLSPRCSSSKLLSNMTYLLARLLSEYSWVFALGLIG